MSRIVMSDIHGCYKSLLALIAQLPKGVPITFAGDLVDRGRDSRKIIDFVKNGNYDCVVGNHEVMMMQDVEFILDPNGKETIKKLSYFDSNWLTNGGEQTLDSYMNPDGSYDVPALKEHIDWLKSLPYHLLYENEMDVKGQKLLVTHTTAYQVWGKLDPSHDRFKDCVTWERHTMPPKIKGIFNVYGHTPQINKHTIKNHFACIDGGCYYKSRGYGTLVALQFPEMTIFEQKNVEDIL